MKRVAYLLDQFPEISETFVLQELIELERLGWDIQIYALHRGRVSGKNAALDRWMDKTRYADGLGTPLQHLRGMLYWRKSNAEGLRRAHRYVRGHRDKGLRRRLKISLVLGRMLREAGIEHVHAHFAASAAEYAMLTGMLTGIPFTFTAHAYEIYSKPIRLTEKTAAAAGVVTISNYNREAIVTRTESKMRDKISVIPCGIDLDFFQTNESRCDGAGDERPARLVSVGRLVEKKGFHYLLDALSGIKEKGVIFECSIIGDGPQAGSLKAQAHRLGVASQVQWLGAQDRSVVRSVLQKADLFILPCVIDEKGDRDGVPVSIKEAMAMGVPVVTTTLPGLEEAVPSGTGRLVEPGSAAALAEAIRQLLGCSREEREAMSRLCRKTALERFDARVQAAAMASVFEGKEKDG